MIKISIPASGVFGEYSADDPTKQTEMLSSLLGKILCSMREEGVTLNLEEPWTDGHLTTLWTAQDALITQQKTLCGAIKTLVTSKQSALPQTQAPSLWNGLIEEAEAWLKEKVGTATDRTPKHGEQWAATEQAAIKLLALNLDTLRTYYTSGIGMVETLSDENEGLLALPKSQATYLTRAQLLQQHDLMLSHYQQQIAAAEHVILVSTQPGPDTMTDLFGAQGEADVFAPVKTYFDAVKKWQEDFDAWLLHKTQDAATDDPASTGEDTGGTGRGMRDLHPVPLAPVAPMLIGGAALALTGGAAALPMIATTAITQMAISNTQKYVQDQMDKENPDSEQNQLKGISKWLEMLAKEENIVQCPMAEDCYIYTKSRSVMMG